MKIALVYLNREKCANHGVGYIMSTVLNAGYDVDFLDTAYIGIDDAIRTVTKGGYDLLLLSASSLFYGQAKRVAAEFKRATGKTILLGGVHATMVGIEVLEDCPEIDYLCIGEGEEFILEFLRVFEECGDIRGIQNLAYRENGLILTNPVRPCTGLGSLPKYRYDIWKPLSVVQPYPFSGMCYVYATRGCPYSCSYCGNSRYLEIYKSGYLRKMPVDRVIEELIQLRNDYPVQFLFFGDEMIVFDEEYVSELFPRIQQEVGLPYGCMARVERVTPSLVEVMRTTGCQYVGMGVECGDEQFRREFLNRRMSNDQIISAFAILRASIPGIKLTSYNMRGYPVPYDDELTEKTMALNAVLSPDIMQMSIFFPLQGTKMYVYCKERGLIDWDKMNSSDDVFTQSVLRRDIINSAGAKR
jgi:anaerobic magnesium-protoporphyrin IX monomethyl ester cyclase